MNNRDERGILAQHIQVNKAKLQLNKVKRELDNINKSQLEQELSIKEMEELIDSELFDLGIEVKNIDLNLIQVEDVMSNEDKQWIKDKNKNKFSKLKGIEFNDYESYINSINMYLEECNIDITKDPINQIFSQDELIKLLDKYNDNYGKLKWSKLDYTVIGISAVIAILLDIFIVAIPKDMKFLGKEYKGSILTKKFKDATVNKCKKNNMLAVAHCTVMSGDILKMWIYGWNPVAFNYSEFLMLVKSVISAIRSENKYNKMIQSELENRWQEIIAYYNVET